MKYYLKVMEDPYRGENAIYLTGGPKPTEHYFTGSVWGITLAHDVLEHTNGIRAIGTIEDEIQAYGAMQYVRGDFVDFGSWGYSGMERLGQELADFINREVRYIRPQGVPDWDCVLEEIAAAAAAEIPQRMEMEDDWLNLKTLKLRIRNHLAAGYNRAERRYGCRMKAWDMFQEIRDTFDSVIQPNLKEGNRWRLETNFDTGDVKFFRTQYAWGYQ